jgi:hypothetical protein
MMPKERGLPRLKFTQRGCEGHSARDSTTPARPQGNSLLDNTALHPTGSSAKDLAAPQQLEETTR